MRKKRRLRLKRLIFGILGFLVVQLLFIGIFRLVGIDLLNPWWLVGIGAIGSIVLVYYHQTKYIPPL